MRVTLTGATGLLGSNLAVLLTESGHDVRCTRRPTSAAAHLAEFPIEWVSADLQDSESLARAFDGADAVLHCAAEVTVVAAVTPQMQAVNVDGTRNVLDAVVVCPSFMFGPFDSRPSSGLMILSIVRGQVPGHTPGVNNFVDVRDVARGMIAAWEKGRRGEAYILGCENLPYKEIMERIAKEAGVAPPRLAVPRPLATLAGWWGDVQERITGKEALINTMRVRWGFCDGYLVSSDKAKRELGYAPGSVDVGIRDALAWFRAHDMS